MTKHYLRIGFICFLLVFPLVFAASQETTDALEKPANLIVVETNAANNSFTIAWDNVPGATGYYVYQIPEGRTIGWRKWNATTPDPITVPTAEVKRITLNTKYTYRVTAFNDNGEGPPSDTVDVNLVK